MNEKELRRIQKRLAKGLGVHKVPADVWAVLMERYEDLLGYAVSVGEEGEEDLLREARGLYEAWRLGKEGRKLSQGREQQKDFTPPLEPLAEERALAFEEYLAKRAATDPKVYRFREKILGGRSLTPEQTRAFVTSPATAFFRRSMFEKQGIPFVKHTAELDDYKVEREGLRTRHRATVSVEPPGITETVQISYIDSSGLSSIFSGENSKNRPKGLAYPDEEGYVRHVGAWKRSVLGELHELSNRLTRSYPWQGVEATWFVLTGEVPAAPPLRTKYRLHSGMHHTDATITLEVAPWVPEKLVCKAFRDMQRRVLGRNNQPIRDKNLKLLRFVLERTEPIGLLKEGEADVSDSDWIATDTLIAQLRYEKVPEGRQLVEEWDRQEWVRKNSSWAYGQNSRRFWRDYHRARRAIAEPSYKWPDQL